MCGALSVLIHVQQSYDGGRSSSRGRRVPSAVVLKSSRLSKCSSNLPGLCIGGTTLWYLFISHFQRQLLVHTMPEFHTSTWPFGRLPQATAVQSFPSSLTISLISNCRTVSLRQIFPPPLTCFETKILITMYLIPRAFPNLTQRNNIGDGKNCCAVDVFESSWMDRR